MRILFICEEYPPGKNGGIGTMVRTLGREMVRQGHQVYVIGLYPHGYGQAAYEEDQGVKVWRLRYHTDIGVISNNFSFSDRLLLRMLTFSRLLRLDTFFSVKRLLRSIRKIVREEGIDIIEMPDWNAFFQPAVGAISVPAFDVPLLVKFNGSHSYFQKELHLPTNKNVYASEYALIQRADALASASRYTASVTASLFHITRPIDILYNSIDLPPSSPAPDSSSKKIIFTGSLLYKKGIHSLLMAWNTVAEKHPDAVLEIYGKGDIHKLRLLLKPAIAATVHFKGHVSQESLRAQFAGAVAAVFPSYSECFALAPLEAMAAGCAVINTSRASGKELIDDKENGLLVDPDAPLQIADAIILLLEDPLLRDTLAAAGKRTIGERFSIAVSGRYHITLYEKVIREFRLQKGG